MKTYFKLQLIVLVLFSVTSFSQNSEIESLKKEFMQLKYENKADREAGAAKLEKVFDLLDKFSAKKKSTQSKEEFASLVQLVAAALPFDIETESAGQIEFIIRDSKNMRGAYDSSVAGIEDACRKRLLQSYVTERACLRTMEISGKAANSAPDACVPKPIFNYEDCIGFKE